MNRENDPESSYDEYNPLTRTKLAYTLIWMGIFALNAVAFIAFIYLGMSGASESTNVEARTNIATLSEWDNDLEDCISWIELSSSNLKE